MRIIRRIKKAWLLALFLAIAMIPISGSAWAHDWGYGGHRGYPEYYGYRHHGGYHHHDRRAWGGYYYSPRGYYTDGRYISTAPVGVFFPGFSLYIGP